MTDILDQALDNVQAQMDEKAEAERRKKEKRRQEEEKKRQAIEERERKYRLEREMEARFPIAVQENQIDEVKDLISKNCSRKGAYVSSVNPVPSVEMAEVIIGDINRVFSGNGYYSSKMVACEMVKEAIAAHPDDAAKWDAFAKAHGISYQFETDDRKVWDTVLEQGFDIQCFDFEQAAENYYHAKNGYVHTVWGGREGDEIISESWISANPDNAVKLKEDLIYVLSKGYKCDLSKKDGKSYLFIQELLKEKELQKQGVDKSFVYRDPSEVFFDEKTGECRVCEGDIHLILETHIQDIRLRDIRPYRHPNHMAEGVVKNGKFTGRVTSKDGEYVEYAEYKDSLLHGEAKTIRAGFIVNMAQYKNGELHGVYKKIDDNGKIRVEKYYEHGVDVTEQHNRLEHIAERKERRDKRLESKKIPEVIKKIGKTGIELDAKIQRAFVKKKHEKGE